MKETIRMVLDDMGFQFDANMGHRFKGRIVAAFDDNVLNVFVFTDALRYILQSKASFSNLTPPAAIRAYLNAIG